MINRSEKSNEDPDDLAQTATVTASAHIDGADPIHILDGKVRDVPGKWDHRWGAEMVDGGQWIELSWKTPVQIDEVQITFDSGFHRQLTLSASDSASKNIIRGPQPETVKEYTVSVVSAAGDRSEVVRTEGNYLRLRRHRLDTGPVQALRLEVSQTQQSKQIRVFEIRCYNNG